MFVTTLPCEGIGFYDTSSNLSSFDLSDHRNNSAIYCPYDESSFKRAFQGLTKGLSVIIDTSSTRPRFEVSSETSFVEDTLSYNFFLNSVNEEDFIDEMLLNDDYIVIMPPVNTYRFKGKITSIVTAKPDPISIEGFSDDDVSLV